MNAYEKLDLYKTKMAQAAGRVCAGWAGEFFRDELLKSIEKIKIPEGEVDFTELTEQEMRSLGFRNWDDHHLLIPIWLFRTLPDSLELILPFDQPSRNTTVADADDDIRGGCVPYCLRCNPNGRKWS
jgi:hypothetical protein